MKTIKEYIPVKCPCCDGSGKAKDGSVCPACEGDGMVESIRETTEDYIPTWIPYSVPYVEPYKWPANPPYVTWTYTTGAYNGDTDTKAKIK